MRAGTLGRVTATNGSARLPGRAPRIRAALARPAVLAAILGILGTAVSAALSWRPSLWQDEAASLLSATRPLDSLPLMLAHVDIVHALYYLVLRGWIAVFGSSAFAIRFPSAIAAGCCVAAVALVARRIGGARLALVAGIICAVLPRMTYDGQDARAYAVDAAIAAWLLVALLHAIGDGRRRWWLGYAALLALGTAMFVFVALVGLAHGVALACSARGRRRMRAWALATGAAFVLASPVIVLGLGQRGQLAYLQGRDDVLTPDTVLVQPWFGAQPLALVGWALVLVGVAVAVRAQLSGAEPSASLVAASALLVPSAALMASSLVVADFSPRYLSMCIPALALTMAAALAAIARRWRPAAVVGTALVVVLAAPNWWSQRQADGMGTDWAEVSASLGRLARPGDGLLFDGASRGAYRVYPAGFVGLGDVAIERPYWRSEGWDDDTLSLTRVAALGRLDGLTRVWFVEAGPGSAHDGSGEDAADAAELHRLGFRLGRRIELPRSSILEFARR